MAAKSKKLSSSEKRKLKRAESGESIPGGELSGSKKLGRSGLPAAGFFGGESGKIRIYGLIIAFLGFALYANTLGHQYCLDDANAITQNWVVQQGVKGIPTIFKTAYRYGFWTAPGTLYRPLSLATFAIDWQIAPNKPFLGHLINVLLYALSGWVLFQVLLRLFKTSSALLPFLAGLIFIAHPIHTEVVANIKSRDELLALLFSLLAFWMVLNYLREGKSWQLGAAIGVFFLGFLSKESTITMMAVIPAALFLFEKTPFKKIALVTGGLSIAAVAYLAARQSVLGNIGGLEGVLAIDNVLVTASGPAEKYATAFSIVGRYFGKLIFPHPLSADYALAEIPLVSWAHPLAWGSLILLGLMGAFMAFRYKKEPVVAFSLLIILATLSIYSNLVIMIGSAFAERFLYVPSIGFALLVAYLLTRFLENKKSILWGITGVIVLLYSVKTFSRNPDWENFYSIYKSDVKHAPNSARMHYWYGNEVMKEEYLKATDPVKKEEFINLAISELETAIRIHPEYASALGQLGLAWYRKGDNKKAREYYLKAIELKVGDAKVYNNLGVIYGMEGNHPEARKWFQTAIQIDPRYVDAYKNLGTTFIFEGNFDQSIQTLNKGLEYDPNLAELYLYLGVAWQNKGDKNKANEYAEKAYQLKPELRPGP